MTRLASHVGSATTHARRSRASMKSSKKRWRRRISDASVYPSAERMRERRKTRLALCGVTSLHPTRHTVHAVRRSETQ